MRFEYENNELDILDEELVDDDNLIFNYSKTLAGNTITIDRRFKLIPTEIPNTFLIERDKNVFEHDKNCEGCLCFCKARFIPQKNKNDR